MLSFSLITILEYVNLFWMDIYFWNFYACDQFKLIFILGMTSGEVSCLADSATMHTVLYERIYFINVIPKNAPLTTFSSSSNLIEGYSKARIMLSNSRILTIDEALYSPRFGRTLLSCKDIRDNNYHVETYIENEVEFMCITSYEYGQKRILEKIERILVVCIVRPYAL